MDADASQSSLAARNTRMAIICAVAVIAMVGASFAAVPLYDMFCRVTGFGGTTQAADTPAATVLDRPMTVRFDGSLAHDMPWSFKPEQVSQQLKIGETGLAFYRVENTSNAPVVGTATFNVTPSKAGVYFNKLECFCFTEQTLQPGESLSMPVTYFIDPAIADDPDLDNVSTITLSYTFFRVDSPSDQGAGEE